MRTMTWSRRSRRAVLTNLSAAPFCQGLRAVDARRTLRQVLGSHAAHEGADVGGCGGSSGAPTRCPAPGPPEALAMPADDGLGLDHRERLLPARPPATQCRPEESIGRAETRSRFRPLEDSKALSEREVLQDQVGPAGEERGESPGDGQSADEHPRAMIAAGTEGNRARPRAIRVSCIGTQLVVGQGGRGFGEGQPGQPGFVTLALRPPSLSAAASRACTPSPG